MSTRLRALIIWFYVVVTFITFVGIVAITVFEVHVRWAINQDFSSLDPNALAALIILFAAQMLGLVWLSRSH